MASLCLGLKTYILSFTCIYPYQVLRAAITLDNYGRAEVYTTFWHEHSIIRETKSFDNKSTF